MKNLILPTLFALCVFNSAIAQNLAPQPQAPTQESGSATVQNADKQKPAEVSAPVVDTTKYQIQLSTSIMSSICAEIRKSCKERSYVGKLRGLSMYMYFQSDYEFVKNGTIKNQDDYNKTCKMFCVAALVRACAETEIVKAGMDGDAKKKEDAEGVLASANFALGKCFSMFGKCDEKALFKMLGDFESVANAYGLLN